MICYTDSSVTSFGWLLSKSFSREVYLGSSSSNKAFTFISRKTALRWARLNRIPISIRDDGFRVPSVLGTMKCLSEHNQFACTRMIVSIPMRSPIRSGLAPSATHPSPSEGQHVSVKCTREDHSGFLSSWRTWELGLFIGCTCRVQHKKTNYLAFGPHF